MPTILNQAKATLKKNAVAQELQKASVPGYDISSEPKIAVIVFSDKIREARRATIEAIERTEVLLEHLDKKSKCRKKYQNKIKEHNHFLNNTASWV